MIGVSPSNLWAYRPNVPLSIQISISDRIKVQETMELAKIQDILSAFFLKGADGSELLPVSGSVGATGTGVKLNWAANVMSLGQEYVLSIRPRRLVTGTDGKALAFMSSHTYRVISADHCGSHGQLNAEYLCVCREGFGGSDCSTCGLGYVQGANSGECVKTLRPVCQPCTCGCDSDNQALGVCDDSSGSLVCTCNPSYTGLSCEQCADSKQQPNYPLCIANPIECSACVHGLCDRVVGECRCYHHWNGTACDVCPRRFAGDDCDRCADGYSGPSCTAPGVLSGWTTWELTLAGAAGLAVILALVIIVLAVRRYRKKKAISRQAYAMNTLGPSSDISDGDDFFDDSISSHEPVAAGLLSDQFNLHLSDDE